MRQNFLRYPQFAQCPITGTEETKPQRVYCNSQKDAQTHHRKHVGTPLAH